MDAPHLTIGFARRGYSPSGGAEAYLKRLARGVVEGGDRARLYTGNEWPAREWPSGDITRIRADDARGFAEQLDNPETRRSCDILLSLERVWRCDVYRAGDGVHAAWLRRRSPGAGLFAKLRERINGKHRAALAFEESLFARGGARRVIANSGMVKREIVEIYGYDPARIDVIPNGVPVADFARARHNRDSMRQRLGLTASDVAVLFVGTGWERKGLRGAISAVAEAGGDLRLLVAGRGPTQRYAGGRTQFLGEVSDTMSLYGAADIFLLPTIYDPFSNACLEAFASGLPVITTTANGFSEIIENGVHGSVVEDPRDIAALAEALRFWMDNTRRDAARPAIQQRAAAYDIAVNVERTLRVLRQFAASAESTSG